MTCPTTAWGLSVNSDQVFQLANLVRSQRELIDDLQRRVVQLEANKSSHTQSNDVALPTTKSAEDQTRRGFLRLAGGAAAGAAVAAISTAAPAAASDGAAVLQAATNVGTGETIVTNTTNSPVNNPASSISALRGNGGDNSVGLFGKSNGAKAAGVQGSSDFGYGIYGDGLAGYSVYAGGGGRYGMDAHSAAGSDAPTSGNYALGDIFRNSVGDVYVCIVAGSALPSGTAQFRKLAGPSTAGATHFLNQPARFVTSSGRRLPAAAVNGRVDVQLSGQTQGTATVPFGATGVFGTVFCKSNTVDSAWVTLFPSNGPADTGTTAATATFDTRFYSGASFSARLSASGSLAIYTSAPSEVIVDLVGYYR